MNNFVKVIVNCLIQIDLLESFPVSDQSYQRSESYQANLNDYFLELHSVDFIDDSLLDSIESRLKSKDACRHAATDIDTEDKNFVSLVNFFFVLIVFGFFCFFDQETWVLNRWWNVWFFNSIVGKTKFTNPCRVGSFEVFEISLFLLVWDAWIWLYCFVLCLSVYLALGCEDRLTAGARNDLSFDSLFLALGLVVEFDRKLLVVDDAVFSVGFAFRIWNVGLVSVSELMDGCCFSRHFLRDKLFSRYHLDKALPCSLFCSGHGYEWFIIERC